MKNVLDKTREELDIVRDNNEYLQNYICDLEKKTLETEVKQVVDELIDRVVK